MSKPLLQKHKNKHSQGLNIHNNTKCILGDIISDTDEDDVKKKIKQMILTKDLFSVIKLSNNEINSPSFNPVKIIYNLPSNQKNDKLLYEDNTIFYKEFLTNLKEENKNESRKRSKQNSNNVNLKFDLKENLKELNNNEFNVLKQKGELPKYLFSEEKVKRIIDPEEKFIIKINKEDENKESQCQKKENVKDINVNYQKLDLKRHLHLPNEDMFNIPSKVNGTCIKSSNEMSNLQLNNGNSYNFSVKSPVTENKFIKRTLKLDTTNIKLPPISKQDKKNNSNPLKNKKMLKNVFLSREVNAKEKEVEIDKEGNRVPGEMNKSSGLSNSEKEVKNSLELKERNNSNNKKRFCGCFDLF